jgi:hypothetical protein
MVNTVAWVVNKSTKHQIPNPKQAPMNQTTMTKTTGPEHGVLNICLLVIEELFGIWCLGFGISRVQGSAG